MVSGRLVHLSLRGALLAGAAGGFAFGLFAGGVLGAIVSWFAGAVIDWQAQLGYTLGVTEQLLPLGDQIGGLQTVADRWYLVAYQCLVVWPIAEDGLIAGEEVYTGEHPRVLKALAAGEMTNLGPVNR